MKGVKGLVAVLYRALQHHDIRPVEVNQMELWEVAVLLGIEEDKRPRLVSKGEVAPAKPEDMPLADRKRIEEAHARVLAERESRGSNPQPI